MLRSLAALALLASSSAAIAQGTSQKPASPAEIAASTASCIAATTATGIDVTALEGGGWQKATATDGRGKPLQTPFSVYGRKGGNTMLMLAPASGARGLCTVMARIDRAENAPVVINALSAQLNTKPAKADKGEIYWFAQNKIVQLATTGDRSKPSVRISVMQVPEKAK